MNIPTIPDIAAETRWLTRLAATIGPCFHPDTPAADYRRPDGQRLFTNDEAPRIDAARRRACELIEAAGGDPYFEPPEESPNG